jgi:hypothetical protein
MNALTECHAAPRRLAASRRWRLGGVNPVRTTERRQWQKLESRSAVPGPCAAVFRIGREAYHDFAKRKRFAATSS